jgi:hypothetical protein
MRISEMPDKTEMRRRRQPVKFAGRIPAKLELGIKAR